MKNKLFLGLVAGCLIIFAVQSASADEIPATTLSMSTILQNLQSQGIVAVQKVDMEDGVYKIKGINVQGQTLKLQVSPKTGAMVKPAIEQNHLSTLQAVKAVEAAGYHTVYQIESKEGVYKMKAIDPKGKQVGLEIDANTGKIDQK